MSGEVFMVLFTRFNRALIAVGCVCLGIVGMQYQANAASVSATASATIISGITVSETTPISFGRFRIATAGETWAVYTDASTTASNTGVTDVTGRRDGMIAISGEANTSVTLSYPATSSIANAATSTSISIAEIEILNGSTPITSGTPVILDEVGALNITVRARISGNGNEAAGDYSGSFNINVNY